MSALPLSVEILGGVAGTLTTLAFWPQLRKVMRTKSTHDLSLGMFIAFSVGVALWLVYGIYLRSLPVILANGVTLVFALIILAYKRRYG